MGLVSGHPLWGKYLAVQQTATKLTCTLNCPGHILYPAAIAMSRFLELHAERLLRFKDAKGKGKAVLELGAGGGLPGLVAALEGADKVRLCDALNSWTALLY